MPGIRYRPTSKKFTIGRTLHLRKVQAQCSFPGTSLFVQRCAMHAQTLNCGTERQHAHSSQRRMMWTAEDIRPHYLAALRNTLKKEITQNDVGRSARWRVSRCTTEEEGDSQTFPWVLQTKEKKRNTRALLPDK